MPEPGVLTDGSGDHGRDDRHGAGHLGEPAGAVDELHRLQRAAVGVEQARADDEHREALRARDGDVEAVAVEEEVSPRGTSSPEEQVMAKNTTAASWPWNLSTVPTRTPGGTRSPMQRLARL